MAKWMPLSSRPGIGRSFGLVAPPHSTMASNLARSLSIGYCVPTSVLVMKRTPSAASRSTRRCTTASLSSFMLGMPYISSPPMRSARSKTVTQCPTLLSWAAQARPDGPEPTTATFLPVRTGGACGTIQPSSKPLSTMAHSMLLIVTGGPIMPDRAGPLAGRRADAAGELGEVVGLVQAVERLAPQPTVDQVVPLGDQVVDRAAGGHAVDQLPGLAEGNAAVHAARALHLELALVKVQVKLVPVLDALPTGRGQAQAHARILESRLAYPSVSSYRARHRSCCSQRLP